MLTLALQMVLKDEEAHANMQKKVRSFNERCMTSCLDLRDIAIGSVYTYYSDNNGCSYIDHCVGTNSLYQCVSTCQIRNECM